MEHKRLPGGAKRVSEWVETCSEAYPKGNFFNKGEITVCYYEADIQYPEGFTDTAITVMVYENGKCAYKQAFYGETADSDARRNGNDQATRLIYASA